MSKQTPKGTHKVKVYRGGHEDGSWSRWDNFSQSGAKLTSDTIYAIVITCRVSHVPYRLVPMPLIHS